jgi:hypothetical protein
MSSSAQDGWLEGNNWPVPDHAVSLFRLSWQVELWLREMVYVELRAHRVSWTADIESRSRSSYMTNDKALRHMATSHAEPTSYLTFRDLWKIVLEDKNWPLFEPYLLSKKILEGRLDEILAIRNRVAHCRDPHENDLARLQLFAKDLDRGLREFCARCRGEEAFRDQAIPGEVIANWHSWGRTAELFTVGGDWTYAVERTRPAPSSTSEFSKASHAAGF